MNNTQWIGINLEQFDTLVQINNGQGNRFDCNYIECREVAGNVAFKFDAGATSNHIRHVGQLYSSAALTLISQTGTNTANPNLVEHVNLLADTGSTVTNSIATAGNVIRKWITNSGAGNASAVLVTPA
ncbi:MAG TPA: hypothetical protein VF054_06665 [Micromonosporaceae bacterium]